jgi:hypothetical protein
MRRRKGEITNPSSWWGRIGGWVLSAAFRWCLWVFPTAIFRYQDQWNEKFIGDYSKSLLIHPHLSQPCFVPRWAHPAPLLAVIQVGWANRMHQECEARRERSKGTSSSQSLWTRLCVQQQLLWGSPPWDPWHYFVPWFFGGPCGLPQWPQAPSSHCCCLSGFTSLAGSLGHTCPFHERALIKTFPRASWAKSGSSHSC